MIPRALDESGERRRRSLGEVLAALPHVVRGFGAERLLLRGAALTYLTIVSMVPLLSVLLLALQTLRLVDFQEPVRRFLFENLAVGVRENVADALSAVIANAGSTSGSGVGVLLLLVSAVLLLRNIEKAFDDLWGIHAPRPLARQLPRYLGLLVAGPVVLGLSLAATAALRTWAAIHELPGLQRLLSLVPLLLSAAGFTLLYLIAPAARVRWRPALVAGVLAALVWELAKLLFGFYAAYAVRNDYLYGPLVAIPLFLVWIYVSWLTVLFGGRLAFAIQHPASLRLQANEELLARALEICAVRMAVALAAVQRERGQPPTLHQLALDIGFPEGMLRELVPVLEAEGLIAFARRRVALAVPAAQVPLATVVRAVRGQVRPEVFAAEPSVQRLVELLRQADEAAAGALEDVRLSDLAAPPVDGAGLPLAKA